MTPEWMALGAFDCDYTMSEIVAEPARHASHNIPTVDAWRIGSCNLPRH
jgi:hypothetical protein